MMMMMSQRPELTEEFDGLGLVEQPEQEYSEELPSFGHAASHDRVPGKNSSYII